MHWGVRLWKRNCILWKRNKKSGKQVLDPTPMGNIITGLVLFAMWPILFGLADTSALAAVLPWALAAAPLVLLTSVQAFRAGNIIGAVANGVLSGVTLVQNGIWGAIVVAYTAAGGAVPEAIAGVKGRVDGAAFLAAAFMLLCISAIFAQFKNISMAFFMGVICLGFGCTGLSDLGFCNLRTPAAVCIMAFAAWMVYSGRAMLMEMALGRKILPY